MNASPHDDPLRPHRHEPNYEVPAGDGSFTLELPDGSTATIPLARLHTFPVSTIRDCYIVSTGHGTTGPFIFGGTRLIDLILAFIEPSYPWNEIEVISADGFGNRLFRVELSDSESRHAPLLAYLKDGIRLTRTDGLVRLIVPTETADALRQVKWVATIRAL